MNRDAVPIRGTLARGIAGAAGVAVAVLVAVATAGCGGCGDDAPAGEDAAAADAPEETDGGDAPVDAAIDAVDAAIDAIDAPGSGVLPLSGAIAPVHDPAIILTTQNGYFAFATGQGLPILRSPDLLSWSSAGQVFASKPSWITTTSGSNPNLLWAPDISFFGGMYHLYYAASTFGSRNSCIGHATTASLLTPVWVDSGAEVICSNNGDEWNAIDPALVMDAGGQPWLAFGSFWEGLKLIPLDADGNRLGVQMYALANRANQAVEAPFIVHHDGFYYLFESVDSCCQGVNSTYKQMVGRAANITGPYVDRSGTPLLNGGGTLLVQGDTRWRGPGHNAVLDIGTAWYNVYHSYDADAGGVPTLRIVELTWGSDGWPQSAGP